MMHRARALAVVLAAPLALSAGSAAAQELLVPQPEAVLEIARGFGTAELTMREGSEAPPAVTGMIDGARYGILLYGCEDDTGCDSVQFFASFTTSQNSLESLNQWNAEKRYASAYRDSDGSVLLQLNANLDFGVTRDNFTDTFDIWVLTLGQFVEHLQ